MTCESSTAQLLRAMAGETDLFHRFADQEADLPRVVQDRDWSRLERSLADLERLAASIGTSEQRRHEEYERLKRRLGGRAGEGFDALVAQLPEQEQGELAAAREQLRAAVGRVRTLTASLAYYFRTIKESVEQIVIEAFPHRRGRIYSRHGRPAAAGADPFVVNHSL